MPNILSIMGGGAATIHHLRHEDGGPDEIDATGLVGAGGGKFVQAAYGETAAFAYSANIIPFDDTIPQNTEGYEFFNTTITPTNAANLLIIIITAFFHHNQVAAHNATVALFKDAVVDALAAVSNTIGPSWTQQITFTHTMLAGTTSPMTLKVRAGPDASFSLYLNGVSAGRVLGGVCASSIVVYEIAP